MSEKKKIIRVFRIAMLREIPIVMLFITLLKLG